MTLRHVVLPFLVTWFACAGSPAPPVVTAKPPSTPRSSRFEGVLYEARSIRRGGAKVRPGEVTQTRRPLAHHTLLVRAGDENSDTTVLAELTTDDEGRFAVDLAPGTYCLVEESKRELSSSVAAVKANVDPQCLEAERRLCDGVITAPTTTVVEIELYRSSYGPCYRGPMPP